MSYGYQGPPVMPFQGQRPPTSFGLPPGTPTAPGAPPRPQTENSGYYSTPTAYGMPQPYPPYGTAAYPPQPSPYAPPQVHNPYAPYMQQPQPTSQLPSGSPYYMGQAANQSSPYPSQHNSPYPMQNTQAPYPPQGSSPYASQNPQQSSPCHQQPTQYQQMPYCNTQSYPPVHNQHGYSGGGSRPETSHYPSTLNSSPYSANSSFPSNTASNPSGMYPGGHGTGSSLYPSCATGLTSSAPQHYQNSPAPRTSQYKAKLSPTVVEYGDFDSRADAEVLRKAMKGFGTDEKSIINVLANRNNMQRQEIATQFKTLYGKDLIKDLKSETSGNFEDLLVAMMTPLPQYYAKELNKALSGIGTDECVLIEVLCTMSNHEIRVIKQAYEGMYGKSLEDDLREDTSGSFKRLMVSLCCANRDESFDVDPNAALQDARELLQAGELRFGTDESTFNAILVQRNVPQLMQIFTEYEGITGHSIEQAIENEFSGDIKKGLLAIVKCVKNRGGFFAEQMYKSMKGAGTDDGRLIRLVVTRSEIDMGEIKQAFMRDYGQSLENFISDDCTGHYKKCLLAIVS